MPDDTTAPQTSGGPGGSAGGITVPDDLKAKFPDLIELILHSESMNDEERQYWINILPIMTPDQIQNLRDILSNEKQQLAAIDAKYSKQIEQVGQEQFVKQVEDERRRRAAERTQAEQAAAQSEEMSADDVLKQIDGA